MMKKLLIRGLIVVVVAMVAFVARGSWRPIGYYRRAGVQMATIKNGLDMWELRHGRYPSADEGLSALVDEIIMPSLLTDPWGRQYVYDAGSAWLVRTLGADGVSNTDDDLRLGEPPHRQWSNPFVL